MLKLKYLFDNRDLARMLLSNWTYDENNLHLMERFRISANAVYPYMADGKLRFLRFAPLAEKRAESVRAELEFLNYLRAQGYPAVETVTAREGDCCVVARTPWGPYVAAAFEGVPGQAMEALTGDVCLFEGYGRSLGQLHRLSSRYIPENRRGDWREQLGWSREVLERHRAPTAVQDALACAYAELLRLPVNAANFGLIHGDFELDNVFCDPATGQYHPIDFDGCLYHWYAMDVHIALACIREELPAEPAEAACTHFLRGYGAEYPLEAEMLEAFPLFHRVKILESHARLVHSLSESWAHEPDWMRQLREKLEPVMRMQQETIVEG